MKNWKTTVIGICAILGAVLTFVVALIDGDPATTPNIEAMIAAISGGIAGIGLVAAKDAGNEEK